MDRSYATDVSAMRLPASRSAEDVASCLTPDAWAHIKQMWLQLQDSISPQSNVSVNIPKEITDPNSKEEAKPDLAYGVSRV